VGVKGQSERGVVICWEQSHGGGVIQVGDQHTNREG
jgi:hypothetical protein